eukprot:TRINITY_DN16297_c0_g1_i1.p2 TRINITY_DN16297_c0_g1~~TRINITY_DN16297_c0_g1_i1.p2  ORF type:complete len:299 (+),score=51.75 TRINITY_DN16297_c0_g1_i1:1666-2562(+)
MLSATVLVVLFAPMIAVFALDENCLRGYLSFAGDLKAVLEAWNMGQQGFGSYRTRVCLRQLVSEFQVVWLNIVLIETFFRPSLELVLNVPAINQLKEVAVARARAFIGCAAEDPTPKKLTLQHVLKRQTYLTQTLANLALLSHFGVLVPLLLLLAPAWAWMNSRSMRWIKAHRSASFGEDVAASLLVQPPTVFFVALALSGGWAVTTSILVDFEFGIGPSVFYMLVSVVQGVVAWKVLRQNQPKDFVKLELWSSPVYNGSTAHLEPEILYHRTPTSKSQPWVDGELELEVNPTSTIAI